MAPPKYILYYFDSKGRAEGIRYMMHYKKQEFDDRRIPKEQWQSYKSQMPMQQLPVLETSGNKLGQSVAIARYVGHELGLYPSGSWEQAKLDEAVDTLMDAMCEMPKWYKEEDEKKKEEIRTELTTKTIPPKLTQLAQLMAISDQQPFLTGKKPVWADFFIAGLLESADDTVFKGQLMTTNKALGDLVQRVKNLDNVKEYVAQRKPSVPM